MKLSRFPNGSAESDDFIADFNSLSDQQQIDFVVDVIAEDDELRKVMLDGLRRRGLLA